MTSEEENKQKEEETFCQCPDIQKDIYTNEGFDSEIYFLWSFLKYLN